jgi:hypothetical protein
MQEVRFTRILSPHVVRKPGKNRHAARPRQKAIFLMTAAKRGGATLARSSTMTSDVWLISEPEGGLIVTLGGKSLAGFYGPNARQLAERHRDLLIAALRPRRRRLRRRPAQAVARRKSGLSGPLFNFGEGSVENLAVILH